MQKTPALRPFLRGLGAVVLLSIPGVLLADLPTPDDLTICNSGIPSLLCTGNIVAETVTTNSSTTIVLDIKPNANFLLWDSGAFGFNWSGPAITVTAVGTRFGGGTTTLTAAGSGNEDGFGTFSNRYDADTTGGLPNAGLTDLTVTITGTGLALTDFVANSNGDILAAHVAPLSDLTATGFVTDGPNGGGKSGGGETPEPVSLLLMGSGLVGVAVMRKRTLSRS
jgi:hypothetical protein